MTGINFKDGTAIPQVGLGTYELSGTECSKSVSDALEIGYRHIDTADRYGNHSEVGTEVTQSGIPREEIFLTTKIWYEDLSPETVTSNTGRFLEELQTDYIDLLLIHWPNREYDLTPTLQAMQQLKTEGKIRAIGVSNFNSHHMNDTLSSGVDVLNNQVEFHPTLNQRTLKKYCDEKAIVLTAYCPLAQGQDLTHPEVLEVAAAQGKKPAEVILNWLLMKNMIVIPRSKDGEHLRENFFTTTWQLSPESFEKMDAIDGHRRIIKPPFADFQY